MKEVSAESKLTRKNRLRWLLPIFWAIILGIMFYTLSMSFDITAFAMILVFLTLIYTTICEFTTKSMGIFSRNSIFIYPLASLVTYILNYFSPKYSYVSNDPYGLAYTFNLYAIFMVFSVFGAGTGTVLARLVSGFEAFCEEPVAVSYSIEGKVAEIHTLLENFLDSINVEATNVTSRTQNYTRFSKGSNQYFLFCNSVENDYTEVNLVILSWRRETIVEPNKDDLKVLFGYFESFLNSQKEKGKLSKWTSSFKTQYENTAKTYIWKYYTSPLQPKERIAIKRLVTQRVVSFLTSHKKGIIAFIIGILTVVIGQLIIRYFIQVLGL